MFVVDRIENNMVVVEFGETYITIPLEYFKEGVSEGDVLYLAVDRVETDNRKKDLGDRLNRLFNRHKNWGGF